MVLERVNSPADLRELPESQLSELAQEIREFIIAAVARTGGHLGSNLGAVELTLALHRVFDSPRDTILWDTGHQAYVHKLVTGRRELFDQLRQAGGLSGYPSRAESEHDLIENSHASTALSWAFGLACGHGGSSSQEPPEQQRQVVAVVGDGALTGGMAYEALNNIGHSGLPVTIVLNDNGRSYAHTVSRLSYELSKFRFSKSYRAWKKRVGRVLSTVPLAERIADAGLEGLKTAVSDAPSLQSFVEALGLRYSGPVDGHDIAHMEEILRDAARQEGPVLVHVLTQKGKGYEPAETDREKKLHDTSAFDVATGQSAGSGAPKWTRVFGDTLLELAEEDPRIIAMTAAMPGSTGLLPLAERFPDRIVDVGIAEQHMVTSAAGIAHTGRVPVVAVYSTFFSRAFDQANMDVGLHDEHVVYCFDRAGITGDDGPSHHGILDMSLCLRIPTMTVLAPSSKQELRLLLREAVSLSGPVSLRFPKGEAVSDPETGEGLRARQVRAGEDVLMISIGDRLDACRESAELLAADGVEAAVWDARCIRPVDPDLLDAAARARLVVTVENGVVNGGAGAYIADRLVERTGVFAAPAILRLGVPDAYLAQADPDRILAEIGLDAAGITATTRKALRELPEEPT